MSDDIKFLLLIMCDFVVPLSDQDVFGMGNRSENK